MIYRLRYCNKDGVEARVDIQKGSSTPVVDVEGTERPFVLSYNNDKGNKSGMFLTSSADIEIYETADFNIDNLKTSNETELSVTYYINNVISWKGFIIPDFFSIEVRNNPVITMTASDRLGTLKNVTLSDLPTMVNLRELAVSCLNKTGLSLPLKTIADFSNDGTVNAFLSYYVDSQRIKDIKGRSISCYDILSSILIASNSKLVQRAGEWVIINKLQHEIGSGKIYSSLSSFTNYLENIYNFEEVSIGARRTIMPVAGSIGIYHEHGGRKSHPVNYDYSLGLSGWNSVNGFVATIENRHIIGFLGGTPLFEPDRVVKQYLLNYNNWIDDTNNLNTAPYISTDAIPINSPRADRVEVTVDISSTMAEKLSSNTAISFLRYAVILTNGVKTYTLTKAGIFEELDPENISGHSLLLRGGQQSPLLLASSSFSNSDSFKGLFEVGEEDNVNNYSATIRVYGSGDQYVTVNYALIKFSDVSELPKGTMYKTEQGEVFTKAYDIETSIFGDYLLSGLDGYFYRYPNDDTSSIYKDVNTLSSPVWTTPSIPNETGELPLLHHSMRQMRRMFSVAHDLLSAEIEVNDFDPLAIFVACGVRHTVVSAQFDFFKSNLSVELEEVAFQIANVRDFIYSYFGDGESGIKSIGGISGGAGGGGGTGGGLTPEQLEILSWWKKDPENPNTIFTEMNAYSKLELSAYGVGDGGGGGGSDYERLDTWVSYDSSKAGWVLSALLGNDLNTRVEAIDGRVTDLENSAGSGSVTSVGISVPTGLSVSNSPITSSGVIAIGLQTGYSIPTTVKQGQWDTAYSNNHTHSNKTVLDGITSILVSNWNAAFTNNHAHSNKTQLDLITQSNIDVLARLSIVNGNLQINGNAYATGELSAYGVGDGGGGGGGGGLIDTVYGYGNLGQTFNNSVLTDTFNAYTINQINTRLVSVESGSATTVNTTGTGNAITSISKSGSVITADKGLTFSLSTHLHTGIYEPVFSKNTAFNKNFGTVAGTVAEGNDSRIINGQTAFSWGNHSGLYLPLTGGTMANTNLVTNLNADLLDGYNSSLTAVSNTVAVRDSTNSLTATGIRYAGTRMNINSVGWYRVFISDVSDGDGASTLINVNRNYSSANNESYTFAINVAYAGAISITQLSGSANSRLITKIRVDYVATGILAVDIYYNSTVTNGIYITGSGTGYFQTPTLVVAPTGTTIEFDTVNGVKSNLGFTGTLTGNATSATKLQTPREIAGVSFDGTANIAIPFANLSSKPTTLGGYGITDAYTKTEVNSALTSKLDKSVFDDLFEKVEVNTGVFAIKAKYNFYGVGEVSAYGFGTGGSGGGSYDRLDAWADYDSSKSGWVLSALLGNELNTRVGNLEGGSALTVNTTGTGNAITSISKSGTVITADKGLTFSLSNHLHTGVYEPVFTKNNAFNKNFGTVAGTVAEGNDSRIINGQTAFGWGNHAAAGYALNSAFNTHNNDNIRHITGAERTKWDGVVTDFEELEIGGRNLYMESATIKTYSKGSDSGNASQWSNIVEDGIEFTRIAPTNNGNFYFYPKLNTLPFNIKSGETYTVSFKYRTTQTSNIGLYDYLFIGGVSAQIPPSLGWQTFSKSYIVGVDKTVSALQLFGFSSLIAGVQVDIRDIKLEKGNKATDWSPAPEDQVSDWNTTDVNSFSFIKNKPTLLSQFTDNIGVATHIANTSNPHSVTKAQVGLGNVDNTSDLNKPISTATQTALNLKANLASPTFTGTVTAPTFIGALSGNATTATALQTARTIWGQSFNGGANVSGAMTGVTTLAMAGALSGATTIEASTSVTTPKVIFNAVGWSMEQVGDELQMKHNNVLKMRFTSTGSIVATEEITAFG